MAVFVHIDPSTPSVFDNQTVIIVSPGSASTQKFFLKKNSSGDARNEVLPVLNLKVIFLSVSPKFRPVVDFNVITLHFVECVHVHLENTRPKANSSMGTGIPMMILNMTNQLQATPSTSMRGSESDIRKIVLDIFQEPAINVCLHASIFTVPENMDCMLMK